jgi:hypothetical protein
MGLEKAPLLIPAFFVLKMNIIKLEGEDKRLYCLVAHLVMDATVLAYNLNYPFRTGPGYLWFIAISKEFGTLGFMPIKLEEGKKAKINNYYVADDDSEVFSALLKEIVCALSTDYEIESTTQLRHIPLFEQEGFSTTLYWKKYAKMKIFRKKKREKGVDEKECL